MGISSVLQVFGLLTVLSLAPGILMMVTSFTRNIVVLSMLRNALGLQQTPPNSVLMSLALLLELADEPIPNSKAEVPLYTLIPAFMLSELQTAVQIGFMIFLPFLLIDLIVSGILMTLGMMMVPPMSISLPVKILVFVLINGWDLVIQALAGSIHI